MSRTNFNSVDKKETILFAMNLNLSTQVMNKQQIQMTFQCIILAWRDYLAKEHAILALNFLFSDFLFFFRRYHHILNNDRCKDILSHTRESPT